MALTLTLILLVIGIGLDTAGLVDVPGFKIRKLDTKLAEVTEASGKLCCSL